METIIFITALFIFLICILLIIFLKTKSDFNNIFNNVFVSQEEINSYLSKKQDCIFRILNILENKLKIDQSIYKSIKV
ncbi:MAG: hypothetical protein RR940_00605, partial [Bacilli bacterium]